MEQLNQQQFLELEATPKQAHKTRSTRKVLLVALTGLVIASLVGYHCYGPEAKHASTKLLRKWKVFEGGLRPRFHQDSYHGSSNGWKEVQKEIPTGQEGGPEPEHLDSAVEIMGEIQERYPYPQKNSYQVAELANDYTPSGGDDFMMNVVFWNSDEDNISRINYKFPMFYVLCFANDKVSTYHQWFGWSFEDTPQLRCIEWANFKSGSRGSYAKVKFTLHDDRKDTNEIDLLIFPRDKFMTGMNLDKDMMLGNIATFYRLKFDKYQCCNGGGGSIEGCKWDRTKISDMDADADNCLVLIDARRWDGERSTMAESLGDAAVVKQSDWKNFYWKN